MKNSIQFLCVLLMCALTRSAFSQTNIASVNLATGAGSVNIPLFNAKSGAVSLPVSLYYQATGLKVKDTEGSAGMGWNVIAGGEISRELRGLPDDCQKDVTNVDAKGWLYNSNGSTINSFTFANNSPSSTCANGTTDLNYISSYLSDHSDTEPDIFHVSAPGLSCSLVFDASHNLKVMPYQDLKVSYTLATDGEIASFTIVNDKGVSYLFAAVETAYKYIYAASSGSGISYFKNEYNRYKTGMLYTSVWKLSSITDVNGNYIQLMYTTLAAQGYSVPFYMYMPGASTRTLQFATNGHFLRLQLASVFTSDRDDAPKQVLSFSNTTTTAGELITSISGYGQTATFNYDNVIYNSTYVRKFLNNFTIGPKKYTFSYNGVTGGSWATVALPDSSSNNIDYWGYYNGSGATFLKPQVWINTAGSSTERYRLFDPGSSSDYGTYVGGVVREPNATYSKLGTLTTVSYSDGGSTTLDYEPNSYYDPTSGSNRYGGGLRVKTITDYDGINTANNIVRNFSYTNPSNSQSYGKPLALPMYAFTTPGDPYVSTDKWNYATVLSETDLSQDDKTIVYTNVKVSQTNAGSTVYEYRVPATAWDNTASPADGTYSADWSPTVASTTRINCATTASIYMRNDKNTYPFAPNPNYNFEQGLPTKVTSYNDAGSELSEINYTYVRTGSPTVITGFNFDDTGDNRSYVKYNIYAGVGELSKTTTTKVFDLPSTGTPTGTYKQKTVTLNYGGGATHKLPTSTEVTNSDGTISRTIVKYTKDYSPLVNSDPYTTTIYRMQQLNMNVPVETYSQLERSGVNKTVGGQLIKYNTFPFSGYFDLYLPEKTLAFVAKDGLTNGSGGFLPSTITSGSFTNYSGYITTGNIQYDYCGFPLTVDDNNHHVNSAFIDHWKNIPVASFNNAAGDEVAFNDFEGYIPGGYPVITAGSSGTSFSTNARSGASSYSVNSSTVFSKSIKKNALASNYIFSIWVNTSASGTITINLNNGSTNSPYYLNYTNTGGTWKYYERSIPLTGMSTTFTMSYQSNTAILIDDMFFYPEYAQVAAMTADGTTYNKTSETNTNGVSRYYTYDTYGRLKLVYDQDKNILQKMSYVDYPTVLQYGTPGISASGTAQTNSSMTFTNSNPPTGINTDGLSYSWNFGDGSTANSTAVDGSTTHTYTSAGTYTATVSMNSPLYGNKGASQSITITAGNIPISVNNVPTGGTITGIDVYSSGTLVASFTQSQLSTSSASIAPGNYTFHVKVSGSAYNPSTFTGYKRVAVSRSGTYLDCRAYTGTTADYVFIVNLAGQTSVNFTVDPYNECGGVD